MSPLIQAFFDSASSAYS